MITIKSVADCDQIENPDHRALLKKHAEVLFTSDYIRHFEDSPEFADDMSYMIYFNKYDDVTKGIPHLPDIGMGLLCLSEVWSGSTPEPGWCWEAVTRYDNEGLYEITIVINNELTVGYFVSDDEFLNRELKDAMDYFIDDVFK